MESHGDSLLMESLSAGLTPTAPPPVHLRLPSNRIRPHVWQLPRACSGGRTPVIKHKKNTQDASFSLWKGSKGTSKPLFRPPFIYHSIYLCLLFINLFAFPPCPSLPSLFLQGWWWWWCQGSGVVGPSQAASCRGYMAHSLFSMSTAHKCL